MKTSKPARLPVVMPCDSETIANRGELEVMIEINAALARLHPKARRKVLERYLQIYLPEEGA